MRGLLRRARASVVFQLEYIETFHKTRASKDKYAMPLMALLRDIDAALGGEQDYTGP